MAVTRFLSPSSYDYGSTVVYQDDSVYINGDVVGTSAEYAEQATEIAEAGMTPEATASVEATAATDTTAAADDSAEPAWQPLGVFAMVQGEEKSSNNIFQLAINKDGVIHGNYYNAVTDTTEQVFGSYEDSASAWMVGDAKKPVYEAGLVNLTKDETSMMDEERQHCSH